MYNIIQKRNFFFSVSGVFIIISLVFIFLGGLKFSIDFTGGALMQVEFKGERPSAPEVEASLAELNLGTINIQNVGEKDMILKMRNINNDERVSITENLQNLRPMEEKTFDTVGPIIGQELKRKAIYANILVLICIIIYLAWAFRKISSYRVSSWLFGINAVIALIHDILITIGLFSVLGYFFNIEVDSLFVTALLTILGFSVHDTIVVFDRIREGIKKDFSSPFETIINRSINETMIRSLNTTITTFLVLIALFLFGGESVKYFVLALMFGIVIGTYSSIFIASPLLLLWNRFRTK
ncbi:MAG: protein translocase subunit SecF [Patescibacteria group bacterium]